MIVVVNANAHAGKGLARWRAVEPLVQARYPHRAVLCETEAQARTAVIAACASGEAVIAAAGGDGCVNLVLNAVMDPETDAPRHPIALGAIGLGSSNDFHKPRSTERDLGGIPVALSPTAGKRMDLGRADWIAPGGERGTSYFLLNSSMGATAAGNYDYNHPTGLLALFKGLNTDLAIQWATLRTIARFSNVSATIEVDGQPVATGPISNLGVIKRQHFAGGMRYDTPVTPDDGLFDVNLCAGMSRLEFIRAVMAIEKGRFTGLPKTHHWRASQVRLVPEAPAPLELDGEVRLIQEVTLRVVPRAIHVCG
ncbi:MAG TPA: diacylglycerol kinase family protein [Oscillatoriaceae cyanobacterium]